MCKELCDDTEDGTSCQDCGAIICWDIQSGDDIMRPAYATSSGDLFCNRCGSAHDRAEDDEHDEPWEEEMAMEDVPIPDADIGGEA